MNINELNHLQVRQNDEEQLVSELKGDEAYQEFTEPVFNTDVGFVSLTIDDGPTVHTERILEILARKQARAIFFMLGENIERYPEIPRRVVEAGHVIGNHSYSHPYFTKISAAEVAEELRRTTQLIEDSAGVTPRYFRPPYGAFNETSLLLVAQERMKTVMWSADPKDYIFNTGSAVFNATEPILASRVILLLHDLKEATADALPGIIDTIREKELETTVEYEPGT